MFDNAKENYNTGARFMIYAFYASKIYRFSFPLYPT